MYHPLTQKIYYIFFILGILIFGFHGISVSAVSQKNYTIPEDSHTYETAYVESITDEKGTYTLTSTTPFTSAVVSSNEDGLIQIIIDNALTSLDIKIMDVNDVFTKEITASSQEESKTTKILISTQMKSSEWEAFLSEDRCSLTIKVQTNIIDSMYINYTNTKDTIICNNPFNQKPTAIYNHKQGTLVLTFPNSIIEDSSSMQSLKGNFIKSIRAKDNILTILIPKSNSPAYEYNITTKDKLTQITITESMPYSVKIKKPSGVKANGFLTTDDYWNKQFIITLPGDFTSFYKENKPVISYNAKSVSITKNPYGKTAIYIKTSSIKGFKVVDSGGYLYITIDSPQKIYKNIAVLDAGHGGNDPGAIGNGLREADINLKISNYAKDYLEKEKNIKVYSTRTKKNEKTITVGTNHNSKTSLAARSNMANEVDADLFISVHINSSASSGPRGTSIYYGSGNQKNSNGLTSKSLSAICYPRFVKSVGSSKRGQIPYNFYVIKYTKMPAILLETAFISNKYDANILKSENKLKNIGKSISDSVIEAFRQYPKK